MKERVMKFSGWRLCALAALAGLVFVGVGSRALAAATAKNKVIIYPSANETVDQLKQQGISHVDNYGSYWVAEVDDRELQDLKATYGDQIVDGYRLDRLDLQNYTIHTARGGEALVPPDLQQTDTKGRRLRLIQFKGPVQPRWLEQVKRLKDVEVLHYVPNNGYLLYLDAEAEKQLEALRVPNGPIQWVGAYHPYYKLSLALQNKSGPIDVNVAAVNSPEGRTALEKIRARAEDAAPSPREMVNQEILKARVEGEDLRAIARMPEVLWITPVIPIRPMDEVQALILASSTNQLPAHSPTNGATYLSFLTNAVGGGLNSFTNPLTYPVVDIADSGLTFDSSNPGIADFFKAGFGYRIAYTIYDSSCGTFDISKITVTLPGTTNNITCIGKFRVVGEDVTEFPHGTIIASVIAGFNNSSTDSRGFRFGMGISPYGLIGSTRVYQPFIVMDDSTTCSYHIDDVFCVNNLTQLIQNQYLAGGRISNNSWGERLVVGENDGVYNARCLAYDVGVRDSVQTALPGTPGPSPLNQELIMVFANGNYGTHGNPGGGAGGFADTTLTTPASAKNVISVGATKNVRLDGSGCAGLLEQNDSYDIAGYSSFGPTRDGRFKPDIVAPDTTIYGVADSFWIFPDRSLPGSEGNFVAPSAAPFFSRSGNYLCGSGPTHFTEIPTPNAADAVEGSSYAAPAVSGGIQLLWWYFQNRLGMLQPSPAMAKAYLLNSARYLPITNDLTGAQDTLPSIQQGMGIMDLRRMFDSVPRVIRDESTPRAIDTPLLATNPVPQQTYFTATGQSFEWTGQVVSNSLPFRVTLAWTDAPGDPSIGDGSQLVNDLNLEVTIGGQLYRGNQFIGPNSVTGCPDPLRQPCPDNLNNVESVFLDPAVTAAVTSGAPWKVVVKATAINGDGVPNVGPGIDQDFGIVIYNTKLDSTLSDLPTAGTNDTCQTATIISSFPYNAVLPNFPGTTYHNCHPSPTAGTGGAEAFWKLPFPTAGTVVSVNTTGSTFNTVLSVWKGRCGALLEDGSARNGSQSALTFTTDGSNDYYIVAEGLNNAGGTLKLGVSATAAPVQFTPTTLDFGNGFVSSTGRVMTAVLNNGTTQPLIIDSVGLLGDNPTDFLIDQEDCAGNILAPGASCTVGLRFSPSELGNRSAFFAANDNAVGSPQLLLLKGTGIPPSPLVCLSANSLSFNTGVGSTSAPQDVIITNCGLADLTITGVGISGPNATSFHVTADTCGTGPLHPDDTCAVSVTFTAAVNQAYTATLSITNDALGSPHRVTLTGVGSQSQPDVAIGKNTNLKKMKGFGIFSSVGEQEEVAQKVKRGSQRGATFFVAVKNAGSSADQFEVTGDGSAGGFTVNYSLGADGTADISGAVTNGTFATSTLAAQAVTGDATMIRVDVTADAGITKGTRRTFTLLFTSVSDPAKKDAVRATVTAK
jgi:hypothetical protein